MLAALSLAAAPWSCGSPTDPSPKEASIGTPFGLRVGGAAVIASAGLRVSFEEVTGDSRCPIGATCIWEGDGVVRVRLESARDPALLDLHTNRGAGPAEGDYLTYTVRLEGLAPHPKVDQRIAVKDYLATLVVLGAPPSNIGTGS